MINYNIAKHLKKKRKNRFNWIVKRSNFIRNLEDDIQINAVHKDSGFKLKGWWKKYSRKLSFKTKDFKVYIVNANWIRWNLCCYFSHGGHGLVHEFIPMNEIWVASHHYNSDPTAIGFCGCKTSRPDQEVSPMMLESTMWHEILEFKEMAKGKDFIDSHRKAIKFEKENYGNPWKDILQEEEILI